MKNLLVGIVMVLAATGAEAATYTTTFTQSGGDVVAVGAGAFDLTGMTFSGSNLPEENRIISSLGFFLFGSGNFDVYDLTMTGPGVFGTGGQFSAAVWSGDQVGIWSQLDRIYVPVGYTSGAALSNSATWLNKTLAELGLTQGTSSYMFGENTYNVVVGPSAVIPVPASLPLLLTALGAFGFARRRHRA
jgi:hypothetical protein